MTKIAKPDSAPQHEVPDGFVLHPTLLATIETAALIAEVTARTVRNWLTDPENPLPAVYREDGAPLIHVATLTLWLQAENRRRPGIGEHGGRRRR